MTLTNHLKTKLRKGETVIGTWAWMPSATVAEILAVAGFDYFIIDMEHGPHGLETAQEMVRAGELHGTTPLVRVPGVDESMILRALDMGAHGVVVPNVQTLDDAERVLRYAKYPPMGERGHSPFTRAGGYSHINATERMAGANDFTFVGLLIEGQKGFESLPAILDSLGDKIDLIYVGVYDLAKSCGHPGDVDHPDVAAAANDILAVCQKSNVAVGILANDKAAIDAHKARGFKFIAYQNDTGILHGAVSDIVRHLKDGQD